MCQPNRLGPVGTLLGATGTRHRIRCSVLFSAHAGPSPTLGATNMLRIAYVGGDDAGD
jgi:hypothetical protein